MLAALCLTPLLAPAFTALGSPISWLELIAFVLAVWMVVCNIRVHLLAWPLAILSSLLYFALFLDAPALTARPACSSFFIALAGWGWWQWRFGPRLRATRSPVRRLGAAGRRVPVLLTLAARRLLGRASPA